MLPSLKDILACQIVTSCRSARSSNVNSNHTFYLLALYQLMSTTAPALPVSSVSWKTALILEYRTGLNDRFMWAQEGRLWPVISVLKSPVGLHWPAGGIGWVKRFFWTSRRSPNEDPETPLERVGPGTPTAGFGREINYVVPQQLADRKERDYTHKEINIEEELNNRKRGMYGEKKRGRVALLWGCRLQTWITREPWLTSERRVQLTALSDGMSPLPPFLADRETSTHFTASSLTCLGPQETPRGERGAASIIRRVDFLDQLLLSLTETKSTSNLLNKSENQSRALWEKSKWQNGRIGKVWIIFTVNLWIWQQKSLNIKHKTAFTKKCKAAVHHNKY